jgi:hypothetical protein
MSLTCQPHMTRLRQVPRMVNSILLRELAAHLREQRHYLRIQYRATTTEAAITEAAITETAITETAITETAITEAILRRRVPERSHLTFPETYQAKPQHCWTHTVELDIQRSDGPTSGKPKWHDIPFKRATRREDCYAHQRHLERCVAGQSTVGRTNQYLPLIFNFLGVHKPRRRW